MWPFQNNSIYGRGQFRWRFADEYNRKELELKQNTLAKFQKFWAEFKKSSKELEQSIGPSMGESLVNFIHKNLLSIEKDIMWESGPLRPSGMKLEFTAESTRHLRPLILTLLEMAPEIPGWTFGERRSPLPLDNLEAGFQGHRQKELYPFTVECGVSNAFGIDVIFSSPLYSGEDAVEDLSDAFILCEMVLGERNLDVWMDRIGTRKSLNSIGISPVVAAEKLAYEFEATKAGIQAILPDSPSYEIPATDQVVLATLHERPEAVPRFTATLSIPNFLSVLFKSAHFNSERLSKFQERFCYLQFAGDKSYLDTDERGKLEEKIDQRLRAAKVGTKIGAGAGAPDSIFIDLCLHDVDEAIPILREISREQSLPKNAKIRFYDADWVHEWIGMYPETNAPRDTTKLWQV